MRCGCGGSSRSIVAAANREIQHHKVLADVRREVWAMRDIDDIERVVRAILDGLNEYGVSFYGYGFNIVDMSDDIP